MQGKRKIPDFVQEDRAGIRQFEAANLLSDRSRESALLMSEEFAFQQVKRYGRAIQFYKWTPNTSTEIVDRSCNQLFPCTRLSEDKDSGVSRCDSFHVGKHGSECLAVADDLFKASPRWAGSVRRHSGKHRYGWGIEGLVNGEL